jgi:hypothetical protein
MSRQAGVLLVLAGAVLVVVGVLAMVGALSWFGRLPGDLRIEGKSTQLFVPLTSMLLVSALLSLLAAVARRLF